MLSNFCHVLIFVDVQCGLFVCMFYVIEYIILERSLHVAVPFGIYETRHLRVLHVSHELAIGIWEISSR